MEKRVTLPVTNENGCYEIRMESIGGLGANLCGKMMGELGLNDLGLNSVSFSSYGSEKTGTPVKSFVRYSPADTIIRVHSPVEEPHLLAVFHEALLTDPTVLKGCGKETAVLINTVGKKECGTELSGVERLYFVDAERIAIDTKSRVNVVMMGAMARIMGFVPLEAVEEICKNTLGRKYPAALSGNLQGIRRGYEEVVKKEGAGDGAGDGASLDVRSRTCGDVPSYGYETAPIGGVNPCFGNSVVNDLSPSRQGFFPIFIKERCINCGLCDSTCPDLVFQFQKGEFKGQEMMVNKGLDYYHCKGCLRCVDVCPVQALLSGVEAEHPDKSDFLPNQAMLRTPVYYEKAGPDGYITSEAYLTEKRMEGGRV